MNRNRTKGITGINRGNRDEIFTAAYDGSYYTIIGCGGDLGEWATGYPQIRGLSARCTTGGSTTSWTATGVGRKQ